MLAPASPAAASLLDLWQAQCSRLVVTHPHNQSFLLFTQAAAVETCLGCVGRSDSGHRTIVHVLATAAAAAAAAVAAAHTAASLFVCHYSGSVACGSFEANEK